MVTLLSEVCSSFLSIFFSKKKHLQGGPYALIALRILAGVGEGTTFPALSQLVSTWIPMNGK